MTLAFSVLGCSLPWASWEVFLENFPDCFSASWQKVWKKPSPLLTQRLVSPGQQLLQWHKPLRHSGSIGSQKVLPLISLCALQCPQHEAGDFTALGNGTDWEINPCSVATHFSPKSIRATTARLKALLPQLCCSLDTLGLYLFSLFFPFSTFFHGKMSRSCISLKWVWYQPRNFVSRLRYFIKIYYGL